MAKPTMVSESRCIVGGPGWIADLSEDYTGLNLNDSPNYTPREGAAVRWIKPHLTGYDRAISVGTVFYGDNTKALLERTSGIVLAISAEQEWDGGEAHWLGLPGAAPADGLLTHSMEFIADEPWASGTVIVPFEFEDGAPSINLPSFTNALECYIALTTKDPAGSVAVTITSAGDTVDADFIETGIAAVDLSSLSADNAAATLSVAALAADEFMTGWLVMGATYVLAGRV